MKLQRSLFAFLILFAVFIFNNDLKAETITQGKYEFKTNDLNEVIEIKKYEDDELTNLTKVFIINSVLYQEELSIDYYLESKSTKLNILNNYLISKYTYSNNKLNTYTKYEDNTIYAANNISNTKYYYLKFVIDNNKTKEINQYFPQSNKVYKKYVMHNNIVFNISSRAGYKNIYFFKTDGYLIKRNTYSTLTKLTRQSYFYDKASMANHLKKIKVSYNLDKNGYLTSTNTYYNNSNIRKSYTNYYAKTKLNKDRYKKQKFIIKNNSKGYITSKVLKSNKKQRTIRKYYYNKSAVLFKNDGKKLKEIKYYTFNRGKVKYTGNKIYKNGKRISSYVKLKNVPYFNQFNEGYASGCEFFSLKMALAYKGVNVSSKTLYKKMPKSMSKPYYKNGKWHWANPDKKFLGDPKGVMTHNRNWGINPKGLELLGDQYRTTHAKHKFSIESIRSELLKGNPVVVWSTFNWNRPAGYFHYTDSDGNKRFTYGNFHVMMVIGMDNKYMYMYDPAIGKKKVSISKFSKSYKPYGQKTLVIE